MLSVFNEAEQYDFDDLYRDERHGRRLAGTSRSGQSSVCRWLALGRRCVRTLDMRYRALQGQLAVRRGR